MKIRKGFVSNSSSSSFICDVCGQDASGYDMSLSDAEMYECENGHIFCEDHTSFEINKEFVTHLVTIELEKYKSCVEKYDDKDYYLEKVEKYQTLLEEINSNEDYDFETLMDEHDDFEYRYNFPSKYCPICQMQHIMNNDIVKYMLKETGKTQEQIVKEMQDKFTDINEFKHYLDN